MAIDWDKELEEIQAGVDTRPSAETLARIKAAIEGIKKRCIAVPAEVEARRELLNKFREIARKRKAGAGPPVVTE